MRRDTTSPNDPDNRAAQQVEQGRAIQRLMLRGGHSQREAAEILGLSETRVSRLLKLARLPERLADRVADGSIPLTHAHAIARDFDSDALYRLAETFDRRLGPAYQQAWRAARPRR